jgi:hypothetical protein
LLLHGSTCSDVLMRCDVAGHAVQTDCGDHFRDYLVAVMTFVEEGQHYPGNYYNQH